MLCQYAFNPSAINTSRSGRETVTNRARKRKNYYPKNFRCMQLQYTRANMEGEQMPFDPLAHTRNARLCASTVPYKPLRREAPVLPAAAAAAAAAAAVYEIRARAPCDPAKISKSAWGTVYRRCKVEHGNVLRNQSDVPRHAVLSHRLQ